ncbi:MAG: TolC family protein [Bacteroidales bacterium]|nr:TolC family protein [Bacteroidales bacterium]
MAKVLLTRIITLFCFIVFASGTAAQDLSFNLKEAREFAVTNSYDVKNSQFDLEMARSKVKENLAYGFPQIDASLDYNYYIALPTSLIPGEFFGQPGEYIEVQFGTKNNFTAGVTLNQLIFDGRYFIGLQYAKISEQLSEENLEKTKEDIIETVSQTYYNILVGEEALHVLDSTLSVLQKLRYETGELLKEGFVELTDYDQLTLTVTDIQNSINSLKRQNEIGYKLLNYQMGIELDKRVILTESLDDVIEQAAIEAILEESFNLENNVSYRLISSQEQIKVLGLQNERAAYYPSLKGFLFLQENAQRDTFTFFDMDEPWFLTSIAGVSMQVPIFSSGMRRHRVSQAKIDLEKIRNTKSQVSEGLMLTVTQAGLDFRTALENFMREKQNVQLSRNIYERTLVKYNEGLAGSVELTQQHNQFFDAERKYFQTVLYLLDAKNRLDKVLGKY